MDARQKVIVKTFTKKQLEGMSIADIATLVGEAGPNAKIRGTAIVRKANGEIRCGPGVDPAQFEGV